MTVSLPDPLQQALEQYQQDQVVPLPIGALVRVALREYLERRGYGALRRSQGLHITPAPTGSGGADGSADHDRHIAEAAAWGATAPRRGT